MTRQPALRFPWAPKTLALSSALAAIALAADTEPPTSPGEPFFNFPQVAFPVGVQWNGSHDDGGSGLDRYEVEGSLNDGGWQLHHVVNTTVEDVPGSYIFNDVEGYWKLRVRAFDRAANASPHGPESQVLTMDLTDPLPPAAAPTASLLNGGTARATWGNGVDPGPVSSGIRLYGARFTSSPPSALPPCQVVANSCTFPVSPGHQYSMFVQSMDNAGNVGPEGPVGRFTYPGPASDLRLLAQGSGTDASYAVVGDPFPVTVEAIDGNGGVVPAYAGTVGFKALNVVGGSDFPAFLPLDGGTYRFISSDQGRRSFSPGFIFNGPGDALAEVVDQFDSTLAAEVQVTVISRTDIRIVHDANPSAAPGVPYLYNPSGRVRVVTAATPVTFSLCGSGGSVPNGFVLDGAGAISWTPEPGTSFPVTLCIQARAAGGATDTYTFQVNQLIPSSVLPQAAFTAAPDPAGIGESVVFDATSSSWDTTLGMPAFRWRLGDGSPLFFRSDPFHAYLLPGGYRPAMVLFDGVGRSDQAARQVLIADQDGNLPPSLAILTLPPSGMNSLNVVLDAQSTDGSAATGPIRWDLGNGASAQGPSAGATYGPGRYWATATTVDPNGLMAMDKVEIAVAGDDRVPPLCAASADPPVAFATPANGGQVNVDWIAWRTPGTRKLASVLWTIDGVSSTQGVVSRPYSSTGWHHGSLTVTDEDGLTCTDSVSVLVLNSVTTTPAIPPRILDPGVAGPIDCKVDYAGRAALASGQGPLTWSLANPQVPLSIDGGTGAVTWTPTVLTGTDQVTYVLQVSGPTGTDRADVVIPYACKAPGTLGTTCGCGETGGGTAIAGLALLVLWAAARRRSAVLVRVRRP
ncbi:MAG TPA: putative Ig domain-containing protein [Myxococcaceae bacterium]